MNAVSILRHGSRFAWQMLLLVFVAVLLAGPSAADDQYPSKPIRLIIPFAAGGPTDVVARLLGEQIAKAWGQPVVVESRPGAGSTLGMTAVEHAPPDGYTLLVSSNSALNAGALIRTDLSFNPIESFESVAMLYGIPGGLSVNSKKVSAKSVKELVELARSQSLSYATIGIGTGGHLLLESLKKVAGVDIVAVPYKGNTPAMMAVVNGEVGVFGSGLGVVRPHVQSGALRMLAIDGDAPSRYAPGVPTFKDIGYPTVTGGTQFTGVWAPPGTPAPILAKLNKAFVAAMDIPEYAAFLDRFAYEKASTTTPEGLAKVTRASAEELKPLVKSLGLKIGK